MPDERLRRTRKAYTPPRPVYVSERELALWADEAETERLALLSAARLEATSAAYRITQAQLEADLHAGEQ